MSRGNLVVAREYIKPLKVSIDKMKKKKLAMPAAVPNLYASTKKPTRGKDYMMTYHRRVHAMIDAAIADPSMDTEMRQALRVVKNNVTIKMSKRMTKAAGQASVRILALSGKAIPETLTLKLSTPIMERASKEEQDDTISHEVAHLVDYVMRGKSDHSYIWRKVHMALGGSGKTYHNINVKGLGRTVKRYEYKDLETGRVVTMTKGNHEKVMRFGLTRYHFLAMLEFKGGELQKRTEATYA